MWWDSSVGLGMPVSISDGAPPFHPLSFLFDAWPIGLLALGAIAILFVADWFAANPNRVRWGLLVLTMLLAVVGSRESGFPALVVVVIAIAFTARERAPGIFAADIVAALLGMWWILPSYAIHRDELPVEMQYGMTWPLVLFGGLVIVGARRRSLRWLAVIGVILTVLPTLFSARSSECQVGAGRSFKRSASNECLSRRAAMLFARAHTPDSPAFDWAGIRTVDGVPNGDPLPDFYLAPRFYISSGTPLQAEPIERDRVLVDHLPAKVAGMGAPAKETVSAGGSVAVERRGEDAFSLRIASTGWNVLVTNHAAWSGWRAYWNGQRLPPVIVNHAFVGSFVPPGSGTLAFRFRPDEVDIGTRIAGGGLLLFVLTLVFPWYQRVRLPEIRVRWRAGDLARRVDVSRIRTARAGSPALHWFWLLLGLYLVLLIANFAGIAGGADSSGYLNQSRLWGRGKLIVPISLPQQLGLPPEMDPMFIPLGFVHGPDPYTMVPSYPPGLPLMITAARTIGGEWFAFRVVAILTAAGVWLMYLLARAYGLSRGWSFAGAAMLALYPTYVFMGVQPMTDSIATAFAIAAILGAIRSRESVWWAVLAGAMMGIGVMIRPTQVLLFPALILATRLRPRTLIAMGLGGLPFAIAQMAISHHLYGNALSTGYGGIGYLLSLDGFAIRFKHYSYWLAILGTPVMFPGGLAAVFTRTAADLWTRAALGVWFTAFFLFYCFYAPYETWWYTRFLLPALPALLVGSLLVLRQFRRFGPLLAAVVVVAGFIHCDQFDVMAFDEGERIYTEAVFGAEKVVPDEAMLVTMQLSGAVRYYAGRETVRWDGLNAESFRQVRGAAGSRPWYALLSQFEIPDAMRVMPGRWVEVGRHRDVILFRLRE